MRTEKKTEKNWIFTGNAADKSPSQLIKSYSSNLGLKTLISKKNYISLKESLNNLFVKSCGRSLQYYKIIFNNIVFKCAFLLVFLKTFIDSAFLT